MATTVADSLAVDLTHAALSAAGEQPFFAGDDWELRFQIRRAVLVDDLETTTPVDLTDATIVLTVRDSPHRPVLWTRTTGVACPGADPATDQIVIDADQVDEDPETETGQGWFAVRATSSEVDELLALAVGLRTYEIRARFGPSAGDQDGDVKVVFAGLLEIGQALADPMPAAV